MLQLHQGRGKLNARVFAQVVPVQTKTDLHTQSKRFVKDAGSLSNAQEGCSTTATGARTAKTGCGRGET
jgi:hypothetical protein